MNSSKEGMTLEQQKQKFEVVSSYKPSGDQPGAIEALAKGTDAFRRYRFRKDLYHGKGNRKNSAADHCARAQ